MNSHRGIRKFIRLSNPFNIFAEIFDAFLRILGKGVVNI
jgi:hypothetical protein